MKYCKHTKGKALFGDCFAENAEYLRMGLLIVWQEIMLLRISYERVCEIAYVLVCLFFYTGLAFGAVQQKFITHLCGLQLINIAVYEVWFQRMFKVAVCSINLQLCVIDGIGKELRCGL